MGQTNNQKRREAQRDGFDDFCEAHQIPYNDECPECAALIQDTTHVNQEENIAWDKEGKPIPTLYENEPEPIREFIFQISRFYQNTGEEIAARNAAIAMHRKVQEELPGNIWYQAFCRCCKEKEVLQSAISSLTVERDEYRKALEEIGVNLFHQYEFLLQKKFLLNTPSPNKL